MTNGSFEVIFTCVKSIVPFIHARKVVIETNDKVVVIGEPGRNFDSLDIMKTNFNRRKVLNTE